MTKLLPSDPPFENARVLGPYLGRKGNAQRRMVTIRLPDRTTTMAYARYLLCVREGRWLTDDEEADHIDENGLNDDPSNLQILTPLANKRKSARPLTMVDLVCLQCATSFQRPLNRVKPGGQCCGRRCGGIRSRSTAAKH